MSRGGARVGAGRKPRSEGSEYTRIDDGRVFVKRSGKWVQATAEPASRRPTPEIKETAPAIKLPDLSDAERAEIAKSERRRYLREWRARRKATA